ncbi:MAG: endopeptidase [Actinomycetota bacterium]|jgi:STE24 endopeptidase|nr:endopeptidase [Actinomycetota bacterium]
MDTGRALAVIVALGLSSAALAALATRAPAEVRAEPPGYGDTDPSLGAQFTDAEIARHGTFRRGQYAGFALGLLLEIAILIVLARGPVARVADWAERFPGGWLSTVIVVALFVGLVTWLSALPLRYVLGYANQHAWGLSNQALSSWMVDGVRSLVIGGVIAAISALAFFGAIRWQPRSWWVFGWIAFTILNAVLVLLWPVLIAPLFNKFTPLEDGPTRARVLQLADEAGVDLNEVYVVDASKRSNLENAYVAGLGGTKRMVLYDTLLSSGDQDETAFVVAHELGHEVEHHVLKGVLIATVGLLAGFAALAWLSHRDAIWAWAGASGVGDVRALPLLLVFVSLATLILLPAQNGVSRSFESRADEIALELTHDPDAAVKAFRRLAFKNLADLRPPRPLVWLLYSHPPIPDRIGAAMATKAPST